MKKTVLVFFVLLGVMVSSGLCEDVLYLKNGKILRGDIIQETPYSIKIQSKDSLKAIYMEEIDHVERGKDPGGGMIVSSSGEVVFSELASIPQRKKELIVRFLRASGIYESAAKSLDGVVKDLPDKDQIKIKKLLSPDELVLQIVPIYAAYYNEEEILVMIGFYENPVIQKNMKLTSEITKNTLNELAKYLSQKLQTMPQ